MLATELGACSQELDHYETLVLFGIYFVLKMFKNIDFYIKQDAREAYAYFSQSKNVI